MNISLSTNSNPLTTSGVPDAKAVAKNEKAARDFEAMLLTPVFDALQKTFAGDSEDSKTVGAADYRQMGSQALAQAIAARGGIGIAKLVLGHLGQGHVGGGQIEPDHSEQSYSEGSPLRHDPLQPPKVSGGG